MSEILASAISAPLAAAKAVAIQRLWRMDANGGERRPYLYCLLDAARDPTIHRTLQTFAAEEEIASLYQGAAAAELAAVAPYLVCLGTRDRIFDWLWEEGWGRSWGILIWSVATFESLREHFRTLTKVRTEEGNTLLFRFYDPRVFSIFLPTCTAAQVAAFFGPVTCFFVETEERANLELFTHQKGLLRRHIHKL